MFRTLVSRSQLPFIALLMFTIIGKFNCYNLCEDENSIQEHCPRGCVSSLPATLRNSINHQAICFKGENLLSKTSVNVSVITEGQRKSCESSDDDQVRFFRIELNRLSNIYAIAIRSNNDSQTVTKRLLVSRNISSKKRESYECEKSATSTPQGDSIFYCFQLNAIDLRATQLGIDSDSIEVYTEKNVSPCEWLSAVEVISYPEPVCGTPGQYENQIIHPLNNFYLVGQTVTYSCPNTRTFLAGSATRTCLDGGVWSGKAPTCVKETSVAPLEIFTSRNGVWGTYTDDGVPVDQKHEIKIKFDVDYCADMLVFEIFNETDDSVRVTNGNGDLWEKVNSISNEKQSVKHRQMLYFRPPTPQEFSCNVSKSFIISTEQGEEIIYKVRLRGLAKAMPGLCPTSDAFAYRKDGMMQPLAAKQTVCPPGYEQQELQLPNSYEFCVSGLWRKTETVSSCKKIRCLVPQSILNGEWSFTSKQTFHQISYDCNWGYAMEDFQKQTLSCSADHTEWSSPPLCQVTNCTIASLTVRLQDEMIVNGMGAPQIFSQISGIQDSLPHGYTFQFSCSHGHRMIGVGRISCENTEWTRDTWCEEILCDRPVPRDSSAILNGVPEQTQWKYGSTVVLTCSDELVVSGSLNETTISLKCQEDGTWWPHAMCVQKHAYGISVSWTGLVAGLAASSLIAFVLASFYYRRLSKTKDFEKFSVRINGLTNIKEEHVPKFVFFARKNTTGRDSMQS